MNIKNFLLIVLFGYVFLLLLEKKDKIKAERYFCIFIFRTDRGKKFLSKIASHKKFWLWIGNIGIIVGIIGMFAIFFFLYFSLYSKYFLRETIGNVQPVIPGVTIPFWYGILALISVVVVHELAHGILALREEIPIKSLGVALLAIIPIGAFVEPDEKTLNNCSSSAKLRVYSAGSFANIMLALTTLALLSGFSGLFLSHGVEVVKVVKNSPSYGVLEDGMVIISINGKRIHDIEDFKEIASKIKPGEDIKLETDKGVFHIKSGKNPSDPSKGFLGIYVTSPLKKGIRAFVFFTLYWVSFLNQGIGLINLAPIHFGIAATDGYYMLKEMLSKITSITIAEKITMLLSAVTFITILLMMFTPK